MGKCLDSKPVWGWCLSWLLEHGLFQALQLWADAGKNLAGYAPVPLENLLLPDGSPNVQAHLAKQDSKASCLAAVVPQKARISEME